MAKEAKHEILEEPVVFVTTDDEECDVILALDSQKDLIHLSRGDAQAVVDGLSEFLKGE